jgi:REP element-mobilizing transposase RayT
MPHFDSNDVTQHVTLHLADSLPRVLVDRLMLELSTLDPNRREVEKRRRLEALVDAGHGACWLRRADCAQVVQDALLHFDGERCRMVAWVVMPNHVHALFQTINGWEMDAVIGSWKSFTANTIRNLLRQRGERVPSKVWHPEFWDRYVRDERHYANVVAYIHNNPVKARLVQQAEEWPWSSANPVNARGE